MAAPSARTRILVCGIFSALLALAPAPSGVPSFDGNTGWLNSSALGPSDVRGKIVLVDFWDYTCINCLRTLPYLRNLYDRYHDDGLVIVGVHAPEFPFGEDAKNVRAAMDDLGVRWPVVLDNSGAIWRRYHNDGWPHEYLFDPNGTLVESYAGEGNYQTTERTIQDLLKKQNPQLSVPPVMALLPKDNYLKPGALCYPQTPEVVLELTHVANAASANGATRAKTYDDGGRPHRDGAMYLDGFWDVDRVAARSADGHGTVSLRYHAIQVVGVLAPEGTAAVRVDITQDGAPVAKGDAGNDVRYDADGRSFVNVDAPRAYELMQNATFGQHELRLHPAGKGAAIYSFAFESCEATPK